MIYLTGSLRDGKVPSVAESLRREGIDVHDDWHAAGPHADDEWKRYERGRGHSLVQALAGEDTDDESGIRHMAHAAWQSLCLVSFDLRKLGTDSRPPKDPEAIARIKEQWAS